MEQSNTNDKISADLPIVKPTDEIVKEYKVANEIEKIITLDLKELLLFQKQLENLQLETESKKSIKDIENVEAKYIDLRSKLKKLLENYKQQGVEVVLNEPTNKELHKSVGQYKDEMEKKFILKKLTHKLYDIPKIIVNILDAEAAAKKLEIKIEEKKFMALNPNKTWEAFGGKEFSIKDQTKIIKEVKDNQEAFIKSKVKTIFSSDESEMYNHHLAGIKELTKNASLYVDAFNNTTINKNNVIGLTSAAGTINTLIKGLMKIVALEVDATGEVIEKNNYIDVVTFGEQIKYHLDDYSIIAAVGEDSIEEMKLVRTEMEKMADGFSEQKMLVNGILGEMIKISSILETKQIQICEADNIVKGNNKVKSYIN